MYRLNIVGFLFFFWINYYHPVVELNAWRSYLIVFIIAWWMFQWAANWMMRYWIPTQIISSAVWMIISLWILSWIFWNSIWMNFIGDLVSFGVFWWLYSLSVFIFAIILWMLQWVWWLMIKGNNSQWINQNNNSIHHAPKQVNNESHFDNLMKNR